MFILNKVWILNKNNIADPACLSFALIRLNPCLFNNDFIFKQSSPSFCIIKSSLCQEHGISFLKLAAIILQRGDLKILSFSPVLSFFSMSFCDLLPHFHHSLFSNNFASHPFTSLHSL